MLSTDQLINRKIESISYSRKEKDDDRVNWASTFDKCSTLFNHPTAEILIMLDNQRQFIISSHCLEDEKGNDYFKLKITEYEQNLRKLKLWNNFELGKIKSIRLFNQTKRGNYHFEKLNYNDHDYLSDAIIWEDYDNARLIVLAHTSIEEHEPRLDLGILNIEEYKSYQNTYIKHWKQKKNYL